MFSSTFIFAKKQFDDEFHRLDADIAAMAMAKAGQGRSLDGYQVVISQVLRTYGDTKLSGLLPEVVVTEVFGLHSHEWPQSA